MIYNDVVGIPVLFLEYGAHTAFIVCQLTCFKQICRQTKTSVFINVLPLRITTFNHSFYFESLSNSSRSMLVLVQALPKPTPPPNAVITFLVVVPRDNTTDANAPTVIPIPT